MYFNLLEINVICQSKIVLLDLDDGVSYMDSDCYRTLFLAVAAAYDHKYVSL